MVTAITLLLLLGATGKSAQIPLYVWLPDAMAGPTPVSALIHAATMVTAGVYMVARTSVLFALAPVGGLTVALIGAATALYAATIGLAQYDIKKVLAYSTISQLGYMFIGVGVGAYAAGIFHLMTHAFFKALLFLGSGAVIHSMHHALHHTHSHADAQDMRNMGGLKRYMPITWITMWVATLAISGIWPFAGFFSKDEIIWMAGARAAGTYGGWFTLIWIMALAAAMITAVYMTRLMVMTFHGENRTGKEEARHFHEAPWVMWLPLAILAALSVFGGWINVPGEISGSFLGGYGLLPMTEWLHEWLHPVAGLATEIQAANAGEFGHVAPFGGGEFLWAVLSTLAALVVVLISARVVGGFKTRAGGGISGAGGPQEGPLPEVLRGRDLRPHCGAAPPPCLPIRLEGHRCRDRGRHRQWAGKSSPGPWMVRKPFPDRFREHLRALSGHRGPRDPGGRRLLEPQSEDTNVCVPRFHRIRRLDPPRPSLAPPRGHGGRACWAPCPGRNTSPSGGACSSWS